MKYFNEDMTVAAAMAIHPRASEAFQGYHLGGCSHCSISEFESIRQVCEGYGVPVEMLLDTLESLMVEKTDESLVANEAAKTEDTK